MKLKPLEYGIINKMGFQHKNLASGAWKTMSFIEQMANVGSEVERAISWKHKGNKEYSKIALYRALELLNLTKNAHTNFKRLREVTRTYEFLVDYFVGENVYKTSENYWKNYFNYFSYLTAKKRGV